MNKGVVKKMVLNEVDGVANRVGCLTKIGNAEEPRGRRSCERLLRLEVSPWIVGS